MGVVKTTETNKTFKAWKVYHALYLHFTSSYDYFKYCGNASWGTIESMEKYFMKYEIRTSHCWQRGFFTSLGKKYSSEVDLMFYYLSQLTRGKIYPQEFDEDCYTEYSKNMNSFSIHLKNDINFIKDYLKEYNLKFNDLFISQDINHPPILKLLLGDDISLETFTVLDICLDFIKILDTQMIDPIWRDQKTLCYNYKPFLEINVKEYRNLILETLKG